jgi:hypothetical protein
MQMRLTVKGVDNDKISFASEKIPEKENEKIYLGRHVKQVIVKRKEQNSPKTSPMTAIAGDSSIPFVK